MVLAGTSLLGAVSHAPAAHTQAPGASQHPYQQRPAAGSMCAAGLTTEPHCCPPPRRPAAGYMRTADLMTELLDRLHSAGLISNYRTPPGARLADRVTCQGHLPTWNRWQQLAGSCRWSSITGPLSPTPSLGMPPSLPPTTPLHAASAAPTAAPPASARMASPAAARMASPAAALITPPVMPPAVPPCRAQRPPREHPAHHATRHAARRVTLQGAAAATRTPAGWACGRAPAAPATGASTSRSTRTSSWPAQSTTLPAASPSAARSGGVPAPTPTAP